MLTKDNVRALRNELQSAVMRTSPVRNPRSSEEKLEDVMVFLSSVVDALTRAAEEVT